LLLVGAGASVEPSTAPLVWVALQRVGVKAMTERFLIAAVMLDRDHPDWKSPLLPLLAYAATGTTE